MTKNKFLLTLLFTTSVCATTLSAAIPNLAEEAENGIKSKLADHFAATAATNIDAARDELIQHTAKLTLELNSAKAILEKHGDIEQKITDAQAFFSQLADPASPVDFSSCKTLADVFMIMHDSATSISADFDLNEKAKITAELEAAKVAGLETQIATLTSQKEAAELEAAKVAGLETQIATLTSQKEAAELEAAKVAGLTSQVSLLTQEANKASTLLSNQTRLEARITELEKQITDNGLTLVGTAPVITPVAPIVLGALTVSAPTVEYTLSDGSTKVNLTEEHISILRAEQKRIVGTGRGSAAKHAAIDSKDPAQLVSESDEEIVKNIASIS